jgi:glyoxylase-like metal-dependent hydrolase (beta-lactamase superfamily II)
MRVEQVSPKLHFARTEHVNWVLYDGDEGLVLVDSGYVGQRALLEESIAQLGRRAEDVTAVLLTHAHADHLGGAATLAREHGTPVYTGADEVANLRRERLEQVAVPDILRNVFRPGVAAWAAGILPLLGGDAALGVPSGAAVPLDGDRVAAAGSPSTRTTPGHTSGHTIFHFADEGVVIAGDALVTGHRTSRRTGPQLLPPMFHHDLAAAEASLDILAAVDAEVLLPGHGPVWRGTPAEAVRRARAA